MTFRLIVILVALALVPTSAATWYGFGAHEPDNGLDDPTLMRFDPPGEARMDVYFNVFTAIDDTFNPNVGALGSDVEVVGTEAHVGVLGRWVDCNGDGYIGNVETVMREYPAELLLDDSLCPGTTGLPGVWNGEPNYRGWVTEYVPIAGKGARLSGDVRLYRDNEAMIWGDYGTPMGEFARGTCPLTPLPRGTTRSTGGVLDYADCRVSQVLGEDNDLASSYNGALAAAGDPLGLSLPDDEHWSAPGHPLHQATFGSSSSEHTIVVVQDCEQDHLHSWGDLGADPLNDFDNNGIRQPNTDPSHVNPSGTLPGTVNYTTESAPLPDQTGSSNSANCEPTDDRSDEFYTGFGLVEGDHPSIPTNPKSKANWNFNFTVTTRGGAPLGLLKTGASGASSDGGIEAYEAICQICDASEWLSDAFLAKPTVQLVRGNLVAGEIRLAAGYYITYYAHAGAATTAAGLQLPGGSGVYGSAQCAGAGTGVEDGWQCDPDLWNFNLDGTPMDEHYPLARVDQRYEMRDVDCYDGTVARSGAVEVAVLPAYYGEDPCAPLG